MTDDLLSSTEKRRLSLTASPYKRQEYLLSRKLMRHALSQHFLRPEKEWIFIEQKNSPPLISNLPEGNHVSLSHSNGLICFALSNSPVGIDIETDRTNRDFIALAQTFMNKEELDHLKKNTQNLPTIFYRTWCAKEAYFKAMPPVEQRDISYEDISLRSLMKNETRWHLSEGKVEECFIAAIVKKKPGNIICNYFPEECNMFHVDITL